MINFNPNPKPAHVLRACSILRRHWHEATFMRGQVDPAAKHLFAGIELALSIINNVEVQ